MPKETCFQSLKAYTVNPKNGKVCNQMYSERMEMYTCVTCLIQPDQPNHSKLLCAEYGHIDESARGR